MQHSGVILFCCCNCQQLWQCIEVYEDTQRARECWDNVVWGYAPGVFCTSTCFYYHCNNLSLDGFEQSLSEDQSFCMLQADYGGIVVKSACK